VSYFPDLSPYTYSAFALPGTVNVGWIEGPCTTGPTPEAFRERLDVLCRESVVNRTGCFYRCCSGTMGDGEVHIQGANGRVYAAPQLILHHVTEHGYLPPEEFIEAVLTGVAVNPEPTCPQEQTAQLFLFLAKRRHAGRHLTRAARLLPAIVTQYGQTSVAGEAAGLLATLEEIFCVLPGAREDRHAGVPRVGHRFAGNEWATRRREPKQMIHRPDSGRPPLGAPP
jgi:hypothetical protein